MLIGNADSGPRRIRGGLAAFALLAGCATTAPTPRAAPAQAPATPVTAAILPLGSSAAALALRFGQPGLEISEHNARTLQFSGEACVLDLYLYPPTPGAEPVVTHVDARRPNGEEMDRDECAIALSQRVPTGTQR